MHWQQALTSLGRGRAEHWVRQGRLVRVLPKVYAFDYVRTDSAARLWQAVLYAGPGAYLTGASAAHLCGLINDEPAEITVASTRRCQSLAGIRVLPRRPPDRRTHAGIPVAPYPGMLLELAAASGNLTLVRFALANLEFRRELDVPALHGACVRGRRGAGLLHTALNRRLPELARCRSPLEMRFLVLLDDQHLQLPLMNRWVCGILVDAYWPGLKLVVELDGGANHGTAVQKRRDAGSTEKLEAAGFTVRRFNWDDVNGRRRKVFGSLAAEGVHRV